MTTELAPTDDRPREIEIREAARVLDVSFADRTIELVVIPYEEEAVVEHRGKMIREVISRGAFEGIQRRANRIKVFRGHPIGESDAPVVGRALSFHPERPEGLVAELRISQTRDGLGDETLTMADDGVLDASAGFGVMPGGERWEERSKRRLTRCFLDHVAMVARPAYDGARVLSVRAAGAPAPSSTPNLDLVRDLRLRDRVGSDPLYR